MSSKCSKVVIVGGGMAGLTTAAYLSKNGYNVTIYEKNDRCGGLLDTFEYKGFYFDSGPRAFVNSGMIRPILKDLGIELEYVVNKISIAVEDSIMRVESMDSLNEYKELLIHLYPENKTDIDKIIKSTKELSKITEIQYEFDNPNFTKIFKDKKFFFKELLPWSFKFLYSLVQIEKNDISMEKYLSKITDNESLKDIITQLFFKSTPSYFALGYFYVYLDYFYPVGGTGQLPLLLEKYIKDKGVNIQLNTEIKNINILENNIVDSNCNKISYDYLIWAADIKSMYKNMNTLGLKSNHIKKIEAKSSIIESGGASESVFILFLGVDLKSDFFKERGGEHLFYTPSKVGLRDIHRDRLEKLLKHIDKNSKDDVFDWLNDFCEKNTFEISIPNLRDVTLSPINKSSVMVSCLFDYKLTKYIEEFGWYDEFKLFMENKIINLLDNGIYKGIKEHTILKFSSSPLTINKLSGSYQGSIVGWAFNEKPPVPNKILGLTKSATTPVKNIYQAGQWAYSPSGVPIAMFTGWYAAKKVLSH